MNLKRTWQNLDTKAHIISRKMGVNSTGKHYVEMLNFKEALEMTTRIHEKLPHFGFMDFDADGTPTIMECNIKGPGVLYYQYVNGPLFGERTKEVIDTFRGR